MIQSLREIEPINLQKLARGDQQEAARFGEAFEKIGFCPIVEHGISFNLLTDCYAEYNKFFKLPKPIKQRYVREDLHFQRGWTPPNTEWAIAEDRPDAKENLFFGPPNSPADLVKQFPKLYPKNIWPEEVPGMREPTEKLYGQFLICGMRLCGALERFLKTRKNEFLAGIQDGAHVMRPLWYPAVTKESVGEILWGGRHTDLNFITLLPPATKPGLMIQTRSGGWIDGQAPFDSVVAQIADEVQYITGGKFLSAWHRVDAPQEEAAGRLSVAFFLHIRARVRLSLLESCVQQCKNPAAYPPIAAGKFVEERLEEINLARKKKPV